MGKARACAFGVSLQTATMNRCVHCLQGADMVRRGVRIDRYCGARLVLTRTSSKPSRALAEVHLHDRVRLPCGAGLPQLVRLYQPLFFDTTYITEQPISDG
jgi:hypothetical protein